MRTVTFGVANSLDNFIARADGTVDWLQWTEEVAAFTSRFWKTIDTVVMGRKTYEVAARSGIPAYPGVKNYVCSRTLEQSPHPAVELVSEDAVAFVAGLKRGKGTGICIMGGGRLAVALFQGDVIDEVGVNIHPVLLGSGIALFLPMQRQVDLELTENQPLGNGCVLLRYRVKHRRPAAA
jgi:dihydrofolate reductase